MKVGDSLECFTVEKIAALPPPPPPRPRAPRQEARRKPQHSRNSRTGHKFLDSVSCTSATELLRHTEMPIGLLTLEIHILDAQSLKDKRQVLRSLKDRLRAHYNVAVAELEHQETWQRSRVGVVTISGDSGYLEKTLAEIAAESERLLGRDLLSQRWNISKTRTTTRTKPRTRKA